MENTLLPRRIAAVLWDFDDTLVDSLPARANALGRVFREANIENLDPTRTLLNLEHKTLEASLACLAESRGRTADLFDRYKRIYWTKEPGTLRLHHGVEAVLNRLEQSGVHLALVTQKARSFEVDGVRAGVSVELEELGITARFPVVIGFEDVSETKPHPEGILKALEQLNIPPEMALMVGDTVADIQAGRAAGCWSCLATWGVPDGPDRARRVSPDLVADAPRDIPRLSFQGNESR